MEARLSSDIDVTEADYRRRAPIACAARHAQPVEHDGSCGEIQRRHRVKLTPTEIAAADSDRALRNPVHLGSAHLRPEQRHIPISAYHELSGAPPAVTAAHELTAHLHARQALRRLQAAQRAAPGCRDTNVTSHAAHSSAVAHGHRAR